MRYLSDNHEVVIEAQGGYAVLESLGFVSDTSLNIQLKKKDRSEKIRAWVAENCCPYCKNKRELCSCTEEEIEMAKKKKAEKAQSAGTKKEDGGKTRTALMLEVQRMGVKNFRVMNKEELSEIVAGASKDRTQAIMEGAVLRWKGGWGKKGK